MAATIAPETETPAAPPLRPAFEAWTYAAAAAAVEAATHAPFGVTPVAGAQTRGAGAVTPASAYAATRAYCEDGDHWQDGETWVGPDGGPTVRRQVLAAVRRQFTPVGVIGEVLDRVVDGVLEREANVTFVPLKPDGRTVGTGDAAVTDPTLPSAAQEAEAAAMRALVNAWWDGVGLWEAARLATRRLRWATRGTLRLWVAPADLVTGTDGSAALPAGLSAADAFTMLRLMAPAPETCALVTDVPTQQACAVFLDEVADGETTGGQPPRRIKRAEVWYTDGQTLKVRVLREQGDPTTLAIDEGENGARLPIAEGRAPLLITEAVRKQQARLDFIESLLTRTAETAGFPERYTINAAASGIWLETAPAGGSALETRVIDGATWYLHEVPRTLGAAITTDLRGFAYESGRSSDGSPGTALTTPSVVFREPTDPAFAIKSAEHARATILESCRQAHVLDSNASASGYSKAQARADFDKDLRKTKAALEGMLRRAIEGAIAWAGAMTTEAPVTGFLTRFRVQVDVHTNSGPATPEEQRENAAQVGEGLLPADDAMVRNGVEDPQAARAVMARDPRYLADLWTKRFTALAQAAQAGADLVGSAVLLGIDPADARTLLGTDGSGNPATNGGVTQ